MADIEVTVTPSASSTDITVAAAIATTAIEIASGAPGPQGPAGDSGSSFDQSLNTTDDVTFNSINTIGASLGSDLNVNGAGSFAGGAATIGADGQFSFQNGDYYSSTDGSGNFLTYKNEFYYQLQFVTLNGVDDPYWNIGAYHPNGSFQIASSAAGPAFVVYDGTQQTARADFFGGNASIDSSGNITAANIPSSFFSGYYSDLTGKPSLGTASSKDVASSGNASSTQVVLGNDSRLTDSRTPTTHSHAATDITSGTIADARLSSNVALLTSSQTLTNKTLTSPVISNGSTSANLTADAADVLAQRNGTTAQNFRVYGTYTDASNYERGVMDWSTNSQTLTIGTQKAGTGQSRVTRIQASGQVDIYPFDLQSVRFSSATSIFYIPIEFAYYSATTDPTTSTIGAGRCAIYRNSTSGTVKLWVNAAGTMKSVALA